MYRFGCEYPFRRQGEFFGNITTDPLTEDTYTYVNGNPLNFDDPNGHELTASPSGGNCDQACQQQEAREECASGSGSAMLICGGLQGTPANPVSSATVRPAGSSEQAQIACLIACGLAVTGVPVSSLSSSIRPIVTTPPGMPSSGQQAGPINLTVAQIREIDPYLPATTTNAVIQQGLNSLNSVLQADHITNPTEIAVLVANLIEESYFNYGQLEPISSYCPTYNGGCAYRGRGFIQLTGEDNYAEYGQLLGLNLVNQPNLALTPMNSAEIALEFWNQHNLGPIAAKGDIPDVTQIINGGQNGESERNCLFERTEAVASGSSPPSCFE